MKCRKIIALFNKLLVCTGTYCMGTWCGDTYTDKLDNIKVYLILITPYGISSIAIRGAKESVATSSSTILKAQGR